MNQDFNKFARMHQGISSNTLSRYQSALDAYINPSIIEERKLNVAQMDVFSRLMMDRIIFLGVQIDDDVANIIIAQLLFLASVDPKADISLYLNTPGGQASDILIEAKEIEKLRTELFSIISEHSGQPYAKVAADGERNFWMTAQEAMEYGMVDQILTKKQ